MDLFQNHGRPIHCGAISVGPVLSPVFLSEWNGTWSVLKYHFQVLVLVLVLGTEVLVLVLVLEWLSTGYNSDRGREFQILGTATLKLREPNDVRTNEAERRLMLQSLRERVEWQVCKDERRQAGLEEWRVRKVMFAILAFDWQLQSRHNYLYGDVVNQSLMLKCCRLVT